MREPLFTPPMDVTDATSCGATPATYRVVGPPWEWPTRLTLDAPVMAKMVLTCASNCSPRTSVLLAADTCAT
ncbi:hypothetical protein D3C86_2194310 [compost metagenome]